VGSGEAEGEQRNILLSMWVRSAGLQEFSGTREAEGDQRNILLSMIKEFHQPKTGLFVGQKTLPAVVILAFVSDRIPYMEDSRIGVVV
jgi:hypothetical protein